MINAVQAWKAISVSEEDIHTSSKEFRVEYEKTQFRMHTSA